ncbi:MAG: hypothetical protein ORN56_05825 [Chitinophagales bacterium]|nr:hypothetical protein [Chitinophagales bacterium]
MNYIIRIFIGLLLLQHSSLLAKNKIEVNFAATYNGASLVLPKEAKTPNEINSLEITKVRFYISQVQLFKEGKCVFKDPSPGHLIDLSDSGKSKISLISKKKIDFDAIQFMIGIDSATTYKGIEKGDLDPSNEMYWSWQSGYINFKLEGYSPFCIKERPKHEFHYHIGGYHFYENTCNEVRLNTTSSNSIRIDLHLEQVLQDALLQEVAHVQLPGTKAASIATSFAHCFTIH